jgi:hypothetical protein
MRKLLLALVALLACSPAWADGPIIKWDRFEGVHFQTNDFANYNVCIGGVICPARPRTGGQGNAILNLETGLLTFRVTGISNPAPYMNGVLGGPAASGNFIGTVVCNSTERHGPMEYVDSPTLEFIDGGGSFTGFVALPDGCKDQPSETVLLLRIYSPGNSTDGLYIAFGAGRTIR